MSSTTFPTLFSAATSMTKEQLASRANKSAFEEDADVSDVNVLALGLLKTARTRHLGNSSSSSSSSNSKAVPAPALVEAFDLASLSKLCTRAAKDVLEANPAVAVKEWTWFVQLATPVEELCPTIWKALDEMTQVQLQTHANKSTPIKRVDGDSANAKERLMLTLARRCNAAAASGAAQTYRKELTAAARSVLAASPKQAAMEWDAFLFRSALLHNDYTCASDLEALQSGVSVRRVLFAEPEPEPETKQAEAELCPTIWAALSTMSTEQLHRCANSLAPVDTANDLNDPNDAADSEERKASLLKAKVLLTMAYRNVTDPTHSKCIYAAGQKVLSAAKAGVVDAEWKAYTTFATLTYPEYLEETAATTAKLSPPPAPAPASASATVQQKRSSSSSSSKKALVGAACAVAFAYCSMVTTMMRAADEGEVCMP